MRRIYVWTQAAKVRKQRRGAAVMGGIVLALLALVILSVNQQQPANAAEWFAKAQRALGMLAGMGLGIWPTVKFLRKYVDSIRYELGEDFISQRQSSMGEVRLRREQVAQVRETAQGLTIWAAGKSQKLFIPRHLTADGYQTIRSRVSAWAPLISEHGRTPLA